MAHVTIPPEAISAAARVLASTTVRVASAEWTHQAYAREALIAAAPLVLAANQPKQSPELRSTLFDALCGGGEELHAQHVTHDAVIDRVLPVVQELVVDLIHDGAVRELEAEKRGAVKALRAEAERGHDAAGAFRANSGKSQELGRGLLRRTADAINARADQIESGQVTL